jgi:hypothetical protein
MLCCHLVVFRLVYTYSNIRGCITFSDHSLFFSSTSFIDEDLSTQTTRRNLNERIAQLSAAIDDVSAQVKNDGFANINNAVELESPA